MVQGDGPDAAMAAFQALVLGDSVLQSRLGDIEIPDVYIDAALAIAAAHDIALSPEPIRAALRPDPAGIGRFMAAPVTLDRWPARGWLPARSAPTGGAPAFDWAWFGAAPLRAPFYEDAVRRFASRPLSQMFRTRTSMAALVADAGAANGAEPAGFIHHMSRCGSTLVAQMLAADAAHVMLSEPEPLDAVLRWAIESGAPLDDQVAAVRAIVAALGRDRSGGMRRVFFKLDSWHTAALPLLRTAFPTTPWVFLYRNPVEVLVSQIRVRGLHTVAGMLPSSILDIPDAEGMAGERFGAMAVGVMLCAVLDHWGVGGGLLVDYAELPGAVGERIAPHFGFHPTGRQRDAMVRRASRSAKAPEQAFVSDSAEKRHAATPAIQAAARDVLDPLYERMKSLRRR